MSNFTIHDAQGDLVFETDELHELAAHLGTSVGSLRVALSNGGGTYVRGRKESEKLAIRRDDAARGKPGPKTTPWRYVCTYPDSEFPDQTWNAEHEILYDEVVELSNCAYQKFAQTTIDQRLASSGGLRLMIPELRSFSFNSVVIKRFAPGAFEAVLNSWEKQDLKRFEVERDAFLTRLKKFKPRRK